LDLVPASFGPHALPGPSGRLDRRVDRVEGLHDVGRRAVVGRRGVLALRARTVRAAGERRAAVRWEAVLERDQVGLEPDARVLARDLTVAEVRRLELDRLGRHVRRLAGARPSDRAVRRAVEAGVLPDAAKYRHE